MSQPAYNLRNIRKLLTTAFTDQELSQLCYEIPEFRPVYEQFTAGMSKDQMIQRLIEYCERKVLMGQLLAIVKEENATITARVYPKGHVNGSLAATIAEAAKGWRIEELHTEEGRLDEVFRSITMPDTVTEEKK